MSVETAQHNAPVDQEPEFRDDFEIATATVETLKHALNKSFWMTENRHALVAGALVTGNHLLMKGPYGGGKTTMSEAIATAVGGSYARVQGTEQTKPSDFTGSRIYNEATKQYDFEAGPVFYDILHADELHRVRGRAQSGLIQAMQEKKVTVGNETYPMPENQLVVATINPDGEEVADVLLDRFGISIGLPQLEAQDRLAIRKLKNNGYTWRQRTNFAALNQVKNALHNEVELSDKLEIATETLIDDVFADKRVDQEDSIIGSYRSSDIIMDLGRFMALKDKRREVKAKDMVVPMLGVLAHRMAIVESEQPDPARNRAGVTPETVILEATQKAFAQQSR